MLIDYFTRDEFREFTHDLVAPYRYQDADIDRAQDHVIRALEAWANSAWPNIPQLGLGDMTVNDATLTTSSSIFSASDVGASVRVAGAGQGGRDLESTITAFTDSTHVELATAAAVTVTGAAVYASGDGRAAQYRRTSESHLLLRVPQLLLERTPVIEVESISVGFTPEALSAWDLDEDTGWVTWGRSTYDPPLEVVRLTYLYGYDECPGAIKAPCMAAAEALLSSDRKMPQNLERYSTEGSTFIFNVDSLGRPPWPWAPDASLDLQAYWAPRRPWRFTSA